MKISKNFTAFMLEKGYKTKGSMFYRIENGILFFVLFEKTPSFIYCNFALWPLYMPLETLQLTYGRRMNSCFPSCQTLPRDADESTAEKWFSELSLLLKDNIFPFWDSVSSAEKLCKFAASRFHRNKKYLVCLPDRMAKLVFYSKCYSGAAAEKADVKKLQRSILRAPYTDAVKQAEAAEIEELVQKMPLSESDWAERIRENISKLSLQIG